MNKWNVWIMGLIVAFFVAGQPAAARAEDDLEKWKTDLDHREQSLKLRERKVDLDRRAAMLEQREQAIKDGRWMEPSGPRPDSRGRMPDRVRGWDECRGEECPTMQAGGSAWQRCPVRRWCGLFIYLAILNIILAVIVYKDMRRADPPMSGLWVVAILMGSIPATVAYGIFRLVAMKSGGK